MNDVKQRMKFRTVFTLVVFVCVTLIALSVLTDASTGLIQNLPYGADTIAFLVMVGMYLVAATIGMGFAHFASRSMYDFVDRESLYDNAKKEPLSSAVYECAISLRYLAVALIIYAFVSR